MPVCILHMSTASLVKHRTPRRPHKGRASRPGDQGEKRRPHGKQSESHTDADDMTETRLMLCEASSLQCPRPTGPKDRAAIVNDQHRSSVSPDHGVVARCISLKAMFSHHHSNWQGPVESTPVAEDQSSTYYLGRPATETLKQGIHGTGSRGKVCAPWASGTDS